MLHKRLSPIITVIESIGTQKRCTADSVPEQNVTGQTQKEQNRPGRGRMAWLTTLSLDGSVHSGFATFNQNEGAVKTHA